jgi:hypothetical protein
LGFFAGAFGIWGWVADAWPVWFPFLVSAPFFLDATVTILRRMLRRERFWRAHREHYYQRLIRSGWSHRRTALCEYALMGASSALAIGMLSWSEPLQYAALTAAGVVYFAIATAIDRRWSNFLRGAIVEGSEGAPQPAAPLVSKTAPVAVGKFEQQPVRIGETRGALVRTAASSRMHGGAESRSRRFDEPAYQQETEGAVK